MEEKQPAEQAVQICGEQGEVDRRGAGFLYDHGHEAVETKHAGTKADVEQSWRERKDRWHHSLLRGLGEATVGEGGEQQPPLHLHFILTQFFFHSVNRCFLLGNT